MASPQTASHDIGAFMARYRAALAVQTTAAGQQQVKERYGENALLLLDALVSASETLHREIGTHD